MLPERTTPLGWSAKGPVKLASRIDTPSKSTVDAGTIAVAGVAWCQHVGVGKVEVRIDSGPWQPAELAETTGPDTWRQWKYTWAAPKGSHSIAVRAIDAEGNAQGGGRSLFFTYAEIRDEAGKLVATGDGTFKYRKLPPELVAKIRAETLEQA